MEYDNFEFQIDHEPGRRRKLSAGAIIARALIWIFFLAVATQVVWFFGFSEYGISWWGNTNKARHHVTEIPAVTVNPVVTLRLEPVTLVLEPGQSARIGARADIPVSLDGISGKDLKIKWTSENPLVARVDQNGRVVANRIGTARIAAHITNANVESNAVYCMVSVRDPNSTINTRLNKRRQNAVKQ